ncbi:quinolinate synthase NadA [Ignicoccus hospitalis]|uniref:Quinolinate synthase n=1 Tax=Ignicoccus hospitalis (strain KIN4/I / DSM 18386 / JCM 14125) TaxID=453591 RepID=A8AA71_IGNH4|nr:quinolinate synthase NadA [Ignicoccus hospitalis]ABU81823.1 quinolinate synthetase A [Ignicoccus hospitalis KIN4/I]HIH90092.1 quinolinate synthase NadA [Desulfurococcaceae archaeon]
MIDELMRKVEELKRRRRAFIIAHNYQLPEVQEVADFVGDSLEMAMKAEEVDADVIVVAGVRFMAEVAKLLNPDRVVLHPEPRAGCPLADHMTPEIIKRFRENYPHAPLVTYVNSSVEAKALSDYVVTSASAVKVVSKLEDEVVLFGPDKNLAKFVAHRTNKDIIAVPPWGHCPVHEFLVSPYYLRKAKERHPHCKLLVHPEAPWESQKMADFVGSTSQMLRAIGELGAKCYILGTEEGLSYRAKKMYPHVEVYPPDARTICIDMKKITLDKIVRALETLKPQVVLDEEVAKRAREAVVRGLELARS